MIFNCKNCKNVITLNKCEDTFEGKLITCYVCKEEWIHHSKTFFLEGRLTELDQDLNRKELIINELNTKYNERINQLEQDLANKKNELEKQKLLEEKVFNFESRITDTEKLNSKQAELENKIFELEKNVKKTSADIQDKNRNIEKKANYLEMKADSISKPSKQENKIAANENPNDIVNFRAYEKKKTSNEINNKKSFFWDNTNDK